MNRPTVFDSEINKTNQIKSNQIKSKQNKTKQNKTKDLLQSNFNTRLNGLQSRSILDSFHNGGRFSSADIVIYSFNCVLISLIVRREESADASLLQQLE